MAATGVRPSRAAGRNRVRQDTHENPHATHIRELPSTTLTPRDINYADHLHVLWDHHSPVFIDNQHHNLPHIHAKYAEFEASVGIGDGEILAGALPRKQLWLVQAWIELHRDELMADWELAVNGESPYKIAPL